MNNKAFPWLTARPIAHRGFHDIHKGIIENCAEAFDRAIAHKFAIELDVQMTADGKVAVFHDDDLDRLTEGTGRLDAYAMDALKAIPFRQDHAPNHASIATLEEILELVAGRTPLVIELKTPRKQDGRLEEATLRALQSYTGPVALMSFSPYVIAHLRARTDLPRGIIACNFFTDQGGKSLTDTQRYTLTHLLHAKDTRPDFISYKVSDLPTPSVDLLKSLYDLPVICWTTTDPANHTHGLATCDQVTFEGYNPDLLNL